MTIKNFTKEAHVDRLLFQGRPYFPRVIPHHGESADDLARMHFNLAWIPDFRDAALLAELSGRGLRAIATPPRARGSGARVRVTVRLRYFPPAGAFGHAVAALFGADPKSEMDADLLRMKAMIETGRPPHDAARPN